MKNLYTLILVIFFVFPQLTSANSPGFIITKDAKVITGKVAEIYYTQWGSEMVFINEMGREYLIHPSYIFGFAIKDGDQVEQFESKYQHGIWRFLKIEAKGTALSLYRSPSSKVKDMFNPEASYKVINRGSKEYWLETTSLELLRIYPLNFKKTLREHMANQPRLLEKLGKEGYRFKNLAAIIDEYNDLVDRLATKL